MMIIIESIDTFKGDILCIILNNGKRIYIHKDIAAAYSLNAGSCLTEEKLNDIIYASDLRRAKRRGMYLINQKEYSYTELYRKLEQNYSPQICYDVMEHMTKNGYINDRRYASMLAYKYMKCKLYGPRRTSQELHKRGISSNIANDAISEYSNDTYDRLKTVVSNKYADKLYESDDWKSIAKVKNALVRLGYDYDDINMIIDEFLYKNKGEQ